jgi:TolB protein
MRVILFNLLSLIFISSCSLSTPTPISTPTAIPTPTPQPTPTPRPDWLTYINPSLGITIQYPQNWRYGPLIENADRYSGEDGFLEVTGFVVEGVSLAGVCAGEANPFGDVYGRNPDLKYFMQNGLDACLVLPSTDQPEPALGRSAIIVRLPNTIRSADVQANHIRVLTSKNFLKDILASLSIKL